MAAAPRFTTSDELVDYICSDGNSDSMCASAVAAFDGDINAACDEFGWTPLTAAVMEAKRETVLALSARDGIDVNREDGKDGDGWSPLCYAAYCNNGMLGVLFSAFPSIDVNHVDSDGKTALHWSAIKGSDVDAGMLLARGADTTIKDKYERAAKQVARKRGNHSVADLIAQHAAWEGSDRRAWLKVLIVSNAPEEGAVASKRPKVSDSSELLLCTDVTTVDSSTITGRVELSPNDVEHMSRSKLGSSSAPLFVGTFDPSSGTVRFDNRGVLSFWMAWTVTPALLRAMATAMETGVE